jgi:hypothetical protein
VVKKRVELLPGVVFETSATPGAIDMSIGQERATFDYLHLAEAIFTVSPHAGPSPRHHIGMPPIIPYAAPMRPPIAKAPYELSLDERMRDEHIFAPGESKIIQGQPQVVFRGEKFVVDDPEVDVSAFVVEDIKVGVESQMAIGGEVPLAALLDMPLELCAAHPGILMSIRLKNISDKPQRFRGKIKGTSLQ